MAELHDVNDDNRQWFLRINGETVFGPVSTQGLIVWAEQGRVLPGHEVSSDRKKWVQAVSLELLGMRWYVDDGEGELRGPLNRLAAEALIKSGKVAEGSQLVSAEEVAAEAAGELEPQKTSERHLRDAMPDNVLQRRIRELESMVNEQRDRLAKLSDASELETVQHDREVLATLLKEAEEQKKSVQRDIEKDARAQERKLDQMRQQVKKLEQQLEEASLGAMRDAELKKSIEFHERRAEETAQILATREAELESLRVRCAACEQKLEQAVAQAGMAETARREVEARIRASEAEMAELLNDANTRDIHYQEKISELEKTCAQPPEETARFFADQAAVYELINAEVSELAIALEQERVQVEQLKVLGAQRQHALTERYQKLIKHVGGSPDDMTRRAVREQPSDPQVARLRADLENLRVTGQREMRLAETKERDLQERIRLLESERVRLQAQVVSEEKKAMRVQEVEEMVRRREHDLVTEQKNREEERFQFEANQRALLTRIETLERAAKPSTPEEIQASEARNVKLASWMRLKR